MRILDNDTDKSVDNLLVLLTLEEAIELRNNLEQLISHNSTKAQHIHLNDETYTREMTIAIYNSANISDFDERVQQLISE